MGLGGVDQERLEGSLQEALIRRSPVYDSTCFLLGVAECGTFPGVPSGGLWGGGVFEMCLMGVLWGAAAVQGCLLGCAWAAAGGDVVMWLGWPLGRAVSA